MNKKRLININAILILLSLAASTVNAKEFVMSYDGFYDTLAILPQTRHVLLKAVQF